MTKEIYWNRGGSQRRTRGQGTAVGIVHFQEFPTLLVHKRVPPANQRSRFEFLAKYIKLNIYIIGIYFEEGEGKSLGAF